MTGVQTCAFRSSDMLVQFDSVCERHYSELPRMKRGLFSYGTMAVVPMFKQMAIRKEKDGDLNTAIMWCERGLAFYEDKCTKPDYEEDLRKRIDRLKKKAAS